MKKPIKIIGGILITLVLALMIYSIVILVNNQKKLNNEITELEQTIKDLNEQLNTENNDSNNEEMTSQEIRGLYQYKKDFNDNKFISYKLYLYDNGTFKYERAYIAPFGEIGTYTIKDNLITLNAQYDTGSDTSLYKSDDKIKLQINSDGTINIKSHYITSDQLENLDEKYKDFEFDNITMSKASTQETTEFLKSYPSVEYIMEHYTVVDTNIE